MTNYALDRNWAEPIRYPDPAVEVIDKRFRHYRLASASIERIWTGGRWAEGPVWFGDLRSLVWSDIPNDRMMRWSEETGQVSVFRQPANHSNGNTRDRQGRLVTCEHRSRRVTRTEIDGRITVLADAYDGKRLNSPNDVVVHPDGGVWFTDPDYGSLGEYEGDKGAVELPTRVYRLDPATGALTVVDEAVEKPNGLAFSPDFKKLYVADTGASHKRDHPRTVQVYDVIDGSRLANGHTFCDFGTSMTDGIRVDVDGNVWASLGWGPAGSDGVGVYAPDGAQIGAIHLPECCANLCFGGVKRNRLFMTASQSVYALYVGVQGTPYA